MKGKSYRAETWWTWSLDKKYKKMWSGFLRFWAQILRCEIQVVQNHLQVVPKHGNMGQNSPPAQYFSSHLVRLSFQRSVPSLGWPRPLLLWQNFHHDHHRTFDIDILLRISQQKRVYFFQNSPLFEFSLYAPDHDSHL